MTFELPYETKNGKLEKVDSMSYKWNCNSIEAREAAELYEKLEKAETRIDELGRIIERADIVNINTGEVLCGEYTEDGRYVPPADLLNVPTILKRAEKAEADLAELRETVAWYFECYDFYHYLNNYATWHFVSGLAFMEAVRSHKHAEQQFREMTVGEDANL